MNSTNEIVDERVDIWGAIKEEGWNEGRGLCTFMWSGGTTTAHIPALFFSLFVHFSTEVIIKMSWNN